MRCSFLRLAVALAICVSLVFSNPWFWTNAQSQRPKPEGHPRPGKPEGIFPDLEEAQQESSVQREPAPPIHSTIRSPKNPLNPWNGRRVHCQLLQLGCAAGAERQ